MNIGGIDLNLLWPMASSANRCRLPLPLLVVANAGIDDDAALARFDDEAVDRSEPAAVLVREMRPESGVAPDQSRRCIGKHEGARKRPAAEFGQARDVRAADPPGQEQLQLGA